MNMGKVKGTGPDAHVEQRIADYLRAHPDFFSRHPEVTARLEIPHACGDAVSLVEHQVTVLRDQNRQVRRRLQDLVNNARDNEELSHRLQRLTLALVDCRDLGEVFSTLYEALRESFEADKVAMRLFAGPRDEVYADFAEFLGADEAARRIFENVLKANNPVCGRLKQAQLELLFGDEAGGIGSGALMPLGVVERFGMLVIGSRDETRFHPGMGTSFLRQLGEIASHVIRPHLAGL